MEGTGEFETYLRAVKGLSAATARNYAGDALRFVMWLRSTEPDTVLADVTPAQIQRYLVRLDDQGRSASTRRGAVFGLRKYFDYAVEPGGAHRNPANAVPAVRADRPEIRPFSAAEVARMDQVLRQDLSERGRLRYAILATLRFTGLRSGEVRSLRADRVDLEARRLWVVGKGGKPRVVPISHGLKRVLAEYLDEVRPGLPSSPWLFPNPDVRCDSDGLQFSASSIARVTQHAARVAGVGGPSNPHRWRHTFATTVLRRGADLHTVQRLLGHSNISTTTVYLHLADEDLQAAVDAAFDPDGS